jgi:hypothetical protein
MDLRLLEIERIIWLLAVGKVAPLALFFVGEDEKEKNNKSVVAYAY